MVYLCKITKNFRLYVIFFLFFLHNLIFFPTFAAIDQTYIINIKKL